MSNESLQDLFFVDDEFGTAFSLCQILLHTVRTKKDCKKKTNPICNRNRSSFWSTDRSAQRNTVPSKIGFLTFACLFVVRCGNKGKGQFPTSS